MTRIYIILTTLSLLIVSGCATKVEKIPGTTSYNTEVGEYWKAMRQYQNTGSLWTEMKSNGTLFLDYKFRSLNHLQQVTQIQRKPQKQLIMTQM